MVNTTPSMHPNPYVNLRPQLPWPPPCSDEGAEDTREIPFKIWDLTDLKNVAQAVLDGKIDLMKGLTKACVADMQSEHITIEYAAELLLLLLTDDDYENSRWCNVGARPTKCRPELLWMPCDAYVVSINQDDKHGIPRKKIYYIKLCLNSGGTMLFLISLHESIYGNKNE